MIVIVDSGSTKADWRIIGKSDEIELFSTTGFNPYYHSQTFIASILSREIPKWVDFRVIQKVYFYGSGCSDPVRNNMLQNTLQQYFTQAIIQIQHDLLGCARATCKNQPGIACILGTGSNSVLYDGINLIDNIPSLGYLLGDEGSGNHLGKLLLRAYFLRDMPADLRTKMKAFFPNGRIDLLNNIYGPETSPAIYLATFSKFYTTHFTHPFLQKLAYQAFYEFLMNNVCKYEQHQKLPIHFVGSIAFYFEKILRKVILDKRLNIGMVIKQPIDQLVTYHQEFV